MIFSLVRRSRRAAIVGILASAMVAYSHVAGATPFRLDYLVSDDGGGVYRYDFVLELDNNDSSWVASQEFASFVIGDCYPSCSSPLTGFTGVSTDPPWTSFLVLSGLHNGPALYPTSTYYVPASVGETRAFSLTSTANLTQGNLLWSNLTGHNGAVLADLEVANRLAPNCGNGVIDAGETCDDSNIRNGDCCGADCLLDAADEACEDADPCTIGGVCNGTGTCIGGPIDECDDGDVCSPDSCVAFSGCVHGTEPASGCITAESNSIKLKYPPAERFKDQIKWKFSGGQMVEQADLGNPRVDRTYALCIYDQTASVSSRVASISIGASTLWTDKDPKGYQFKSKSGLVNGVAKVALKTGADGKSSASLMAKGNHVPMPVPVSGSKYMNKDSKVIVQLVNDQTSMCWTSEFTAAKKNDGATFQAKTP